MKKNHITKEEFYNAMLETFDNIDTVGTAKIPAEKVIDFIKRERELVRKKASRSKALAEEKKAFGDELKNVLKAVLTDQPQNLTDIIVQIEGEDLTKAKLVARLTDLVNEGVVAKEKLKDEESGRQLMYYRLK